MQTTPFHKYLLLTLLLTWMGLDCIAQTQINHFPTIEKYSVLFGDGGNAIASHIWDGGNGIYIGSGYADYYGVGNNEETDTLVDPGGMTGWGLPLIAKFDTNLRVQWTYHISARNGGSYGYIQDLDLDSAGNLLSTIIFLDTIILNDTTLLYSKNRPSSNQGILILTLSPEGEYIQHLVIDPPFPNHCMDLELDSEGNLYLLVNSLRLPFVSGGDTIPVSAAGNGTYHGIVKLNTEGEILDYQVFRPLFGTPPLGCYSLAIGPQNELALLVDFRKRISQTEAIYLFGTDTLVRESGIYLIKLRELNEILWIKDNGEVFGNEAKVTVDEDGSYYVSTPTPGGGFQTGVSKFSTGGKRLWSLAPSSGIADILDWHPIGDYLFVTGYYQGSFTLGSASWSIGGAGWGASTLFVGLVERSTGNPIWFMSDGVGNQIKAGYGIFPVSGSKFILGGALFSNYTSFDSLEIVTQSAPEGFLIKFSGDFLPVDSILPPEPVSASVYPNPSYEDAKLLISGEAGDDFSLVIIDDLGRQIYKERFFEGGTEYNLPAEVSSGIYFVLIKDNSLEKGPIIIKWIKY